MPADEVGKPANSRPHRDLHDSVYRNDQAGLGQRESRVRHVRHLVHRPRHRLAGRDPGRDRQQVEDPPAQHLRHVHPRQRRGARRGAPLPGLRAGGGLAVREQAVRLRPVPHNQGDRGPDDEDQQRHDHERLAPARDGHQQREQRDHEVPAAAARGDNPHGSGPLAMEPVHDRGVEGRARGEALPQRRDHARRVVDGQIARLREEQQAARKQHHPAEGHPARAEPIDQRPADRRQQALLEAAQREPQGDRSQAPAQLLAHRVDQHTHPERGNPEHQQIHRHRRRRRCTSRRTRESAGRGAPGRPVSRAAPGTARRPRTASATKFQYGSCAHRLARRYTVAGYVGRVLPVTPPPASAAMGSSAARDSPWRPAA